MKSGEGAADYKVGPEAPPADRSTVRLRPRESSKRSGLYPVELAFCRSETGAQLLSPFGSETNPNGYWTPNRTQLLWYSFGAQARNPKPYAGGELYGTRLLANESWP
jgi:hypothetical protein